MGIFVLAFYWFHCLIKDYIYLSELDQNHFSNFTLLCHDYTKKSWFSKLDEAQNTRNDPLIAFILGCQRADITVYLSDETLKNKSLCRRMYLQRWSFCNVSQLLSDTETHSWKAYYLRRSHLEMKMETGRSCADYTCKSLRGHKGKWSHPRAQQTYSYNANTNHIKGYFEFSLVDFMWH